MEEHEMPSAEYVTDFNNGYLLAKEKPEIASILRKQNSSLSRSGLVDGINQFYSEKSKENRPSWLDSKKSNLNTTPSKGLNRDDIELDKE